MVSSQTERGFTLVEMLVSLALFTTIATMAVGTLLILINGNSRVVGEQITLTALSFALDSMTREIRTGSEYYCGSVSQVTGAGVYGSPTAVQNCTGGNVGLSFREAGESITGGNDDSRIAYYFENNRLWRKVGSQSAQEIVTNDVEITEGRFIVTGATPLGTGTDIVQPTVTILIEARASSSDATKTFTLQSTVTQRALDL
ncbi:MAG: prepilin-type N-terminal cleavage/methylation domain-containing protein [Candidatus Pacebacteria bacterium]|jgi:prepilin-type N-terminal cleavage/methylation domain-containing protein|nr:prepilin-type N-terminal cleavage/methylation domain-containing protein [Candidatus Paceibacterota bacterium]